MFIYCLLKIIDKDNKKNRPHGTGFLLSKEAISRFLPHKDLLTLDLKYYEKNSTQI